MSKAAILKELLKDKNGYVGYYYDLVDELVAEDLKDTLRQMQEPSFDPFETVDNKTANMAAFCRVLSWYLTNKDYKEFMKELQGDKTHSY